MTWHWAILRYTGVALESSAAAFFWNKRKIYKVMLTWPIDRSDGKARSLNGIVLGVRCVGQTCWNRNWCTSTILWPGVSSLLVINQILKFLWLDAKSFLGLDLFDPLFLELKWLAQILQVVLSSLRSWQNIRLSLFLKTSYLVIYHVNGKSHSHSSISEIQSPRSSIPFLSCVAHILSCIVIVLIELFWFTVCQSSAFFYI